MRVPLPKDNWVEFKTADEILEEDREAVLRAAAAAGDDPALRVYASRRQWMIQLIKNWSLQQPVPSTEPKSLGKIPMTLSNALAKELEKVLGDLEKEEQEAEDPPAPSAD